MAWNLFGKRQSQPLPSARPCLEILEDRVVLSAPVLTLPMMPHVSEGSTASAVVSASNPNHGTLTYLASALPIGLSINPTSGLISGLGAYNNTSNGLTLQETTTITVSDGVTYASNTLIWSVTDTNRLPTVAVQQFADEGQNLTINMAGTDNSGTNSLSYSASGLPGGETINASTGLIGGVLGYNDASIGLTSSYFPTVTLADNHGGTDTRALSAGLWIIGTWYVTFTPIAAQQNSEGNVISLYTHASDSQAGSTLTYTASSLPAGLSITSSSGLISGTIAAGAGRSTPYVPTITAASGANLSTQTFNWGVASRVTLGPIPTLQNTEGDVVSFHTSATDSLGTATLTYSISGLPGGLAINASTGLISGTIAAGAGNTASYSPTLTAGDGTASLSQGFIWNVASRVTLGALPTQQNTEGNVVSFKVQGTDSLGTATLTYSQSGLPTGLAINNSTGLISGTIVGGAGNTNSWTTTITAGDGTSSLSQSFIWNVASRVTIGPIPTQQNNEGNVVSFNVKATDALGTATLTYSQAGLPTGLSLNNSTGLISGTISAGAGNSGSFTPTITVGDGTSSLSQSFIWNLPARVTLGPIPTQQNNEGNVVSFKVQGSDSVGTATLTYSQSGLPTGLAINASTGLISGNISTGAGNSVSFTPTITASDGTGRTSQSFLWNVGSRITLGPIATLQNNEGDSIGLHVKATDSGTATLTYFAGGLPSGLTINSSTGLISGTIGTGTGNVNTYTPTIVVYDGTAYASETFSWNVANLVTIGPIGTLQNNEGNVVSFQVKATDGTSALTYTAMDLPNGVTINPTSGVIAGTIAVGTGNTGTFAPVVTVNDGTDVATESFAWNVNAPLSIGPIGTLQNNEGNVIAYQIKALDGTASLTYTAAGLPTGLTINPTSGLISGTIATGAVNLSNFMPVITVNDGTDVARESFTWFVNDLVTIGPIGSLQNNEGNVVTYQVKATDGTSSLTYTAAGLPNGLSLNPTTGLISGTIAAGAGNAGFFAPVVSVNDGTDIATETFGWNVNAPLSIGPIGTLQNNEGNVISYAVKALDGTASLTYTALGLPTGLSINPTSGLISGTIATGAGNISGFTPIVTVNDGTDSAAESFTWIINDLVTIGPIGSQQNNEGNVVSYQVKATDGTSSLTYTAAGLPNGLTLNSTSGLISGTIEAGVGNAGFFSPVVTVNDGTDIATESFGWNVNAPLSIGPIGTQQNNEGDVVSYAVKALDGTASLTYMAAGLPNGLSINPTTGLISGTIAAGDGGLGAFSPVITVTDGTDIASEAFGWNVANLVTIGPIGTLQNNEGNVISYQLKATDGTSSLTYTAAGLPNGLSLNPTTGLISGTIAAGTGNFGAFTPVVTVNDGTDIASEGFSWNVNAPLSIGPIGTQQNNEGNVVSFAVKALDGTASLTYSAAGLPNGLSIIPTSGLISGTIAAGAGNFGVFSPIVTVTDGTDSASENFGWNVANLVTIGPIGTLQNKEGNVVSYAVKALDGTAALTYTAAGLPNGLSINPTSGLISGTIAAGAGNFGAFAPTVTVSDGTDSASEGFTWNVNAPLSIGPIGTLQNNEGNVVSYAVKATDGTASLTYTAMGLPNGLSINPTTGLISGTIAAGDGGLGAFSPVISVTDGTDSTSEAFGWNIANLVTIGPIGTLQNNEGNVISYQIKATDGTSSLTYTAAGLPNGLSLNPTTGLISGTIAAGTGNFGAFSPVVTVNDGIDIASEGFGWNVNAPLSIGPIGTLQNNEGNVVSYTVKALDGTASLTYSAAGLPNGLSINPTSGLISGTIAAGVGNFGAFSPTVTVSDGTVVASEGFSWNVNSPLTIGVIADQQNSEGNVISFNVKATDGTASLTYTAAGLPNGLSINPTSGLISGTLAAGAGNNGAFAPVITVVDGTASASMGFTWSIASAITISGIAPQRNAEGSTVSLALSATDANTLSMTYSAVGLPNGLTINPTSGLISGTIAAGAGNTGAFTPVITVEDGTSSASASLTWNIASAITVAGLFTQQSSEGHTVSLQVSATDANTLSMTYSASGLPSGLSINPTSGLISGTIAAGAANNGAFTPVVTVQDGTAMAAVGLTWNVGSAVSIGVIGTKTNTEGNTVSFSISATDANTLSLTYSAAGLPNGLSISPTSGLISGTLAAGVANNGAFAPVITVQDGTAIATQGFNWNISSAVSIASIATQQKTEGNTVSLQVSATDANTLSLTYSASGLPNGLSISPTSGLISGTLAAGVANMGGAFVPIITVGDGTAINSTSFTFSVSSAISLGSLAAQQNTAGNTVSLQVSATDANSLSLTYSASGLPTGLSINPTSGLISGTIVAGFANGGGYAPVIGVTDGTTEVGQSLTWTIGPLSQPDSYCQQENTTLSVAASIGVLANDTAPAGTTLTATKLMSTSFGTLSLASNGSFTYIANSNWYGTDSFIYVASDCTVTSSPVTVTIQVQQTLPQPSNDFRSVATGDFNGDGNQDFVAANFTTNKVSVFLGNGDGTFQTPTTVNVGQGPLALAVGNFGNNAEDIAVVNSTDGTVTILLNNGGGSFTTSQTLTVSTNPTALALGDFEGNGRLDLAVVNTGSNSISVFLNNGTGTFTLDTTLTVGTAPSSVAAADLNNDGNDDLVVANSGSNNVGVLLSNGNGTFASQVTYTVGISPSAVVTADFNGDGNIDVAVANSGSNTVSVMLGNGDGTLSTASNYGVGSNPVALAVGSFGGIVLPDLTVANQGTDNESILTNTGAGVFALSQTLSLGESPHDVAVADFHNTGCSDQIIDAKIVLEDDTQEVTDRLGEAKYTFTRINKQGKTAWDTQHLVTALTGSIKGTIIVDGDVANMHPNTNNHKGTFIGFEPTGLNPINAMQVQWVQFQSNNIWVMQKGATFYSPLPNQDKKFTVNVPKNSNIPNSRAQTFTTSDPSNPIISVDAGLTTSPVYSPLSSDNYSSHSTTIKIPDSPLVWRDLNDNYFSRSPDQAVLFE